MKGYGPELSAEVLTRFEFHRQALALMPDPEDKDPGVAVMVDDDGPGLDFLNCNCATSRKTTCAHIKKLAEVHRFYRLMPGDKTLEQDFRESIWHRIATVLADGSGDTPQTVRSQPVSENGQHILKVYGLLDEELLTYISAGSDRSRFEDRCIVARKNGNIPSRTEILAELMLWTLTENEREMSERGFKTRRQVLQEKFWYRMAYHAYRDFGTHDFTKGSFLPDASVKALNIFRRPERINITPRTLERDWCWLSVVYGFGNSSLSLSNILQARAEGRRYIEIQDGWMDAQSPEFEGLDVLLESGDAVGHEAKKDRIKISRLELLRLQAAAAQELIIDGRKSLVNRLHQLLNFKPCTPFPETKGMVSKLRTYQQMGSEWISFLYENGFGGLLCDDMGLGKTHGVMAFMLYLRKHRKIKKPFLVVCPTTVLSHWREKIRDHAPGLKAVTYHGGLRDIDSALKTGDVLLTSYGILRRDIRALQKRAFGLIVFDEIQHIKNRLTLSYVAAVRIRARMKLGLTGTPIENTLAELKTLMDLVIPGYLGRNEAFITRYDRWWNAAREDQATDRVHRIGQQRGVQVFKLVTEGTLEEKISAIIEKKKSLMNGVVKEDDPGLLKTFSRKQLIELLSVPETG